MEVRRKKPSLQKYFSSSNGLDAILTRRSSHLERQGGGTVGLRGPGEKQIEVDKRLMRDKITSLKRQIDLVQSQRELHRKGRRSLGLPVVALVGYTNAGKSTLLNTLTSAGVMAEDVLFATLDPTTRKVKLPGLKTHPEVMLTDTVGFIQNLPTHLIASFRATLEEVETADVLVHVIDASNPIWRKQVNAVEGVLEDMGCGGKGVVRVYNKIDLLEDQEGIMNEAAMQVRAGWRGEEKEGSTFLTPRRCAGLFRRNFLSGSFGFVRLC